MILTVFALNLAGTRWVSRVAWSLGIVKVAGLTVFSVAGLWLAESPGAAVPRLTDSASLSGFLGATALGILAFKGFTTITNSGSEIVDPHRNIGRAIVLSIGVCIAIYVLVGGAVAANLPVERIVETKNYSLAAAARPVFGELGAGLTVALVLTATGGGLLASIFAVSRMLAMLTEMRLVPHRHFGMPGQIRHHTLVYTVVLALLLTAFVDLSRIAALGIVLYLTMDIAVHWGVLRHLRRELEPVPAIPVAAIGLDALVLGGFVALKIRTDPAVLLAAVTVMAGILALEQWYFEVDRGSASDALRDR